MGEGRRFTFTTVPLPFSFKLLPFNSFSRLCVGGNNSKFVFFVKCCECFLFLANLFWQGILVCTFFSVCSVKLSACLFCLCFVLQQLRKSLDVFSLQFIVSFVYFFASISYFLSLSNISLIFCLRKWFHFLCKYTFVITWHCF